MARVLGRLSKILISADAGSTWLQVNGMKEATFSGNRSEIKATAHNDGDFENYLAGRIDGSIDMKLYYDDTDAAQTALTTAWLSGSTLMVKYVQHPGATFTEYAGSCIVTKHEEVGGDNDAAMTNTTLRIKGAFVQQDQPTDDETPVG